MKYWKRKILVILIAYFAGFATAIYFLAPVDREQNLNQDQKSDISSVLKSDELAKSFNSGMHKCMDFVKRSALRTGNTLKDRYYELQKDS